MRWSLIIVICFCLKEVESFTISNRKIRKNICYKHDSSATCKFMSPEIASIIAGSLGGSIGVGVAFPLDTLKTKSQVLGNASKDLSMMKLIKCIYEKEGFKGFYGGVRTMMIGQAFIKAMAFATNSNMNLFLEDYNENMSPLLQLVIAASVSGFVTSFAVAPFERIKIMMQASGSSSLSETPYENEVSCMISVIKTDGVSGLLLRGLGVTLLREIPSYGIYFVVYGVLMTYPIAAKMGSFAPLVMGGASGCLSWIPVYPIDVVKTLLQNTQGNEEESAISIIKNLYQEGGIQAFFDGLTPKMLRAAVNHAVTFWVFDLTVHFLTTIDQTANH